MAPIIRIEPEDAGLDDCVIVSWIEIDEQGIETELDGLAFPTRRKAEEWLTRQQRDRERAEETLRLRQARGRGDCWDDDEEDLPW